MSIYTIPPQANPDKANLFPELNTVQLFKLTPEEVAFLEESYIPHSIVGHN